MIHLTNSDMWRAIAARRAARPSKIVAMVSGATVSMTLQPPGHRTAELAALVASASPALSARLRRMAAVERVAASGCCHGPGGVVSPECLISSPLRIG